MIEKFPEKTKNLKLSVLNYDQMASCYRQLATDHNLRRFA